VQYSSCTSTFNYESAVTGQAFLKLIFTVEHLNPSCELWTWPIRALKGNLGS
jgi:hypothetical protein